MTRPRAGARRLIAAALLVPGLLISHPLQSDAAASPGTVAAPSATRTADAPARAAAATVATKPAKAPPHAAKPSERKAARGKSPRADVVTRAEDRCVHVVRAGESVGRVAARYRVTRHAVLTENRLPGSAIKAGQRLAIPGCKRGPSEPVNEGIAVELDHGLLLARVGPDRIQTRLYVAVPEFGGDSIDFSWPVDGPIASGFGRRRAGWHAGIDIQAEMGARVLASAPGTVIFSGWAASYGRAVRIQHSNGFVTVYAHNHENLVQIGDVVDTGTVIATVGKSGRASSHHLHFEIRRDGMAFNPLYLLDSRDQTPVLASTRSEPASEPVAVVPLIAESIDEDPDE